MKISFQYRQWQRKIKSGKINEYVEGTTGEFRRLWISPSIFSGEQSRFTKKIAEAGAVLGEKQNLLDLSSY